MFWDLDVYDSQVQSSSTLSRLENLLNETIANMSSTSIQPALKAHHTLSPACPETCIHNFMAAINEAVNVVTFWSPMVERCNKRDNDKDFVKCLPWYGPYVSEAGKDHGKVVAFVDQYTVYF